MKRVKKEKYPEGFRYWSIFLKRGPRDEILMNNNIVFRSETVKQLFIK